MMIEHEKLMMTENDKFKREMFIMHRIVLPFLLFLNIVLLFVYSYVKLNT